MNRHQTPATSCLFCTADYAPDLTNTQREAAVDGSRNVLLSGGGAFAGVHGLVSFWDRLERSRIPSAVIVAGVKVARRDDAAA